MSDNENVSIEITEPKKKNKVDKLETSEVKPKSENKKLNIDVQEDVEIENL